MSEQIGMSEQTGMSEHNGVSISTGMSGTDWSVKTPRQSGQSCLWWVGVIGL